jgi:hypothetical protein
MGSGSATPWFRCQYPQKSTLGLLRFASATPINLAAGALTDHRLDGSDRDHGEGVTRSGQAVKHDSAAAVARYSGVLTLSANWVAEIAFRACSESGSPLEHFGVRWDRIRHWRDSSALDGRYQIEQLAGGLP